MNFDLVAKSLLREAEPAPTIPSNKLERANTLVELAAAGFSLREIFNELRSLYDSTDEDTIKRALLEMVIKVHGLYKEENIKEVPKIIFNITGDKKKIESMLCPPGHSVLTNNDSINNQELF